MTPTNDFVRAVGAMLSDWIGSLDAESAQGLSNLIAAGAMLQVQTSWSRAGHVETAIILIQPNGDRAELAALEFVDRRTLS